MPTPDPDPHPLGIDSNRSIRDHATEFFEEAEALTIEDSIWWACGRRSIIRLYMDQAKTKNVENILEIGCGSGGDLELLSRYGRVWGLERSAILAARARRRGVAVAVAESDLFDCEIDTRIDLFCLFDVLEHVKDDRGLIQRLSEKGHRDHLLLLSVPACQFLFGRHDELLHHYRRYSRARLEALLRAEGYDIVRSSYFMFLLFPLAVLSRVIEAARVRIGFNRKDVNLGRVPAPVNWLFTKVLQLEARLGQYMNFPIGLWLVVLAERKS